MAQVFSNLISNAIQHGRPESVIKISMRGLPDEVIYEVRNEGESIPPAKLRNNQRMRIMFWHRDVNPI
jgi:signal transduction histidine kinase